MKKISLLLLVMTLGTGLCHAFKYVYKDVTFKCDEDHGAITITSFDNDAEVVVIPGSINGMPVKKVDCFINGNNYLATELVIEEGVEEIAKFCFNEFRRLQKVTLPSTLSIVRSNAFRKGDIEFYGPRGFNVNLVRRYSSRLFNGTSASDPDATSGRLLAAGQSKDSAKELKARQEIERQSDELDKKIAKRKAELERLNRANEELELEKKRQELLALEEATQAAKKQKKGKEGKDKKSGGNMFSKLTKGIAGIWGGGDDDKEAAENTPTQPDEPLVAQEVPVEVQEVPVVKRKLSDVDINIPRTNKVNESTFCFIIANETYDELPTVNFAENDGKTFKQYCVDALGVPESQVFLYTNASYTSMMRAFKKMESLADATGGKSKFVFYYAGHGTPGEEDQSAYIVPSDGLVTVTSTCFALSDVYKRFGNMAAESVVVFLDACFSGLNRDNSGLIAARAVARKPKQETVTGNVIVLAATSEAETAMGYEEKGHGMFTYHVLKQLQRTKGDVKFSDLFQAVSEGVRRDSIIKNDKNQTPSLAVSAKLKARWKNLCF